MFDGSCEVDLNVDCIVFISTLKTLDRFIQLYMYVWHSGCEHLQRTQRQGLLGYVKVGGAENIRKVYIRTQ